MVGDELSNEDKLKFVHWLNAKGIKACPMCGQNKWAVGERLVVPNTWHGPGAGLVVGGVSYPQAMLICGNCAYTAFYNAVVVGLVSGKKEPEGDEQKPGGGSGTS